MWSARGSNYERPRPPAGAVKAMQGEAIHRLWKRTGMLSDKFDALSHGISSLILHLFVERSNT